MSEKYEQLEELAKNISNWIKENGNPYTQVVVTAENVRVTETVAGFPVNDD